MLYAYEMRQPQLTGAGRCWVAPSLPCLPALLHASGTNYLPTHHLKPLTTACVFFYFYICVRVSML